MDDLSPQEVDFEAGQIGARFLNVLSEYLLIPSKRKEISRLANIPEKTLVDYLNGRSSPSVDRFLLIAVAARANPAEFFGVVSEPTLKLAPSVEIVHVPHLDVEAAAGAGCFVDVVLAEASFPFPYPFLEKLLGDAARYARLETLRAKGDSMAPTIEDGALLMLDRAQSTLPPVPAKSRRCPAEIYVFIQKGDVRLKRLQRIDSDFIAIHSDNRDEFPPEVFNLKRDGSFKIIGKIVWWDNRL